MLCIEKERLPSFPDARGEIIKSFVSSTILIENLVFRAHCMCHLKGTNMTEIGDQQQPDWESIGH